MLKIFTFLIMINYYSFLLKKRKNFLQNLRKEWDPELREFYF